MRSEISTAAGVGYWVGVVGSCRTCTSGNQHLTADHSSYCTCQQSRSPDTSPVSLASLPPIHPHFKVNVTSPPCSLSSHHLCVAFFKLGLRVRELTCNKPVTDEASLRNRQEDIWQGLDADIKSQEMHSAPYPCHVLFAFLVSVPALPAVLHLFLLCPSLSAPSPLLVHLLILCLSHSLLILLFHCLCSPLLFSCDLTVQQNCDIHIDSNKTETKCKCAVLIIAVQV